jgi:hypothetical protein
MLQREGRKLSHSSILIVFLLGVCLFSSGCEGPATIWKEEVRSPDGAWTAIGLTEQQGGPGNDWCATTVSLKRTNVSESPTDIVGITCHGAIGQAYTLDNIANAGGTIGLQMKWLDLSHLEVTYDKQLAGELYYQVVKTSGLDISVKDISAPINPAAAPDSQHHKSR